MKSKTLSVEEKKYTVKELWESCYYTFTDCDDDYDGFVRVVSTINGTEFKIPLKDFVLSLLKSDRKRLIDEFEKVIGEDISGVGMHRVIQNNLRSQQRLALQKLKEREGIE